MAQTFQLALPPTAKGRPRLARGRVFTPAKTRHAEAALVRELKKQGAVCFPAGAPIRLEVVFYVRRPAKMPKGRIEPTARPDLDNFLKLVCDSGNGVLWADDGQVVEIYAAKRYAKAAAHIALRVSDLDEKTRLF